MKNNFDLKKFLTENKLTANTRQKIKEDFSPSPNTHLPEFANGEDFDVATAFKKARVDMSKPVAVMYHYGHAQYSGEDTDVMSAEAAIKKLEAERQEVRKNYTDDGEEVPSDRHGYEFENYSVLEEHMPEGHEYKLSYYLDGDYTYAITQEKSGKVKEAWGFQSDFAKNREKKGGVPTAKRKAGLDNKRAGTLQVSKGSNAEQEQKVIDIARDAIALMDEQPKTSAVEALKAVLGI